MKRDLRSMGTNSLVVVLPNFIVDFGVSVHGESGNLVAKSRAHLGKLLHRWIFIAGYGAIAAKIAVGVSVDRAGSRNDC